MSLASAERAPIPALAKGGTTRLVAPTFARLFSSSCKQQPVKNTTPALNEHNVLVSSKYLNPASLHNTPCLRPHKPGPERTEEIPNGPT